MWLRMLVLLVGQIPGTQSAYSAPAQGPQFKEEVSKQTDIYQSQGEDVPKGYVVDRSLLSYAFTLSSSFNRSLADLGPKDRWLDIGAGEGRAILDYCTSRYDAMIFQGRERPEKKAKAVAISIEDRRTIHWHRTAASLEENQIQYLIGKRLREYSLEELGQFLLITDVLGGFSYSQNLSLFIEKTLGFLALNGSFYTVLQDVRSEKGTNRPFYPDAAFLTEITNAEGAEVTMCSWLKNISCVEVTCELKTEWSPPVERYHIRKVCDNVTVPALVPVHFTAGTPPERRFHLRSPSAVPLSGPKHTLEEKSQNVK